MPSFTELRFIEHLGDGCYVAWDGYHIVLMANSHINPTDTVGLDPDVWKRLKEWAAKHVESAPCI